MIFSSRKARGPGGLISRRKTSQEPTAAIPEEHESLEGLFEEIDALDRQNRASRDPEIERRLLELRHGAGRQLTDSPVADPEYPAPAFDRLPNGSGLPEVAPGELTPGLLRAAILRSGCLLIRGLVDAGQATRLVEGIDRAFEAREEHASGRPADSAYYEEFVTLPQFNLKDERRWVAEDAGGLWGADSPRVMFDMLDAFERSGLRQLGREYLGERPAISVNKCTLRRVKPDTGDGAALWHQDGAFLGDVRALNVWLSLSHCGDVAPGLDIVPRRVDHIVPTGTEGAVFRWSVSQTVAEEAAGDIAITRPIFEPGDVLLFDELCLHATAAESEMPNTRYAIESWFFGPSGWPGTYAPLAV
jgi:Phytanoyl-CoA dioxygenase (PhyH)